MDLEDPCTGIPVLVQWKITFKRDNYRPSTLLETFVNVGYYTYYKSIALPAEFCGHGIKCGFVFYTAITVGVCVPPV